jgi:serine/threonine protein kinase
LLGKILAHYEITELLGKGGMGEVYRASDSKLGRDVAIKILPTELSNDPERAARFEREARMLASLQHANIASIYGYENVDNTRFLAMELADGEDLGERLERGPIPVEEVVDLAIQFAEGLEAAHAVGIIHRDLKPANLKVSSAGRLKILDFGLARAYSDDVKSQAELEHSPTITAAMTQDGVILGTAAYMSPEQARGKPVDHRTDIWGYGIVLFGMLTGQRMFDGETVSDTLAGVLRADIPWDQLPKDTPPTLRRIMERCLDRDPSRRLQAIAEARIALEDLNAGRTDETGQPAGKKRKRGFTRERIVWIAAVAALILGWVATNQQRDAAPEQPLTHSTFSPPFGWDFAPGSPFAVSPDGRRIAFGVVTRPDNEEAEVGDRSLWVRDLSEPEARQLAPVEDEAYPFWSPDGRWIGFRSGGKLNKIEARGGPVIPLCDAATGRGGTWNEASTIVFQRNWSEGLMTIPALGGTPEPLTTLNKETFEVAHRWPHFLPNGRQFLFYVVSTTNTLTSERSGIYIGSLDSDETKFLLRSESRGVYASGHILYRSGTTLMARPFDLTSLEFIGDPIPITTDIPGGAISWGGAHFGATESGTLVHMRGIIATSSVLNWRDRTGKIVGSIGEADGYWEPALSNDGTRLAVAVGQDVGDIWIYDLERGSRTRFTFDPADDRSPLWSPDDSRIVFESSRTAPGELYVRPTSGQGKPELLHTFNTQLVPSHWSSDGRYVFATVLALDDNAWDLWVYDMETSEARPIVTGPFNQMTAALSPDGRWLAFASDESGRSEVYVQAFPEPGGRWMVSDGGWEPMWNKDGSELLYLEANGVATVPVSAGPSFSFGTHVTLFPVTIKGAQRVGYGMTDDGSRIFVNEVPPANANQTGARLIQNWTAALER